MYHIPNENNIISGEERATLENHSTELNLPVFNEETAITIQPNIRGDTSYPGNRRPIPVSTTDWQSTNTTQFIPSHGLEFLSGVEQLYVQQTVELNDLFANVASENRYKVKIPRGETLYYATETSTSLQRSCFASSRSFDMRLFDQTQQEALYFKRRLACGTCSFWCYLQRLEVWVPPGEPVGYIQQQPSTTTPTFLVYNRHVQIIYRIEGPDTLPCVMHSKNAHFKIYTADGSTQIGAINHQWDQVETNYNLCLQFPGNLNDSKPKALLLGAAFLLEYMYFEQGKKPGCFKCIC